MPLLTASTVRLCCSFLLFSLLCITTRAQFEMQWEKPIGTENSLIHFKNITCAKQVNNRSYIAYMVTINGNNYPAISSLDADGNSLNPMNDFSVNKRLKNYTIIDIVAGKGDSLICLCNDYNNYGNNQPIPVPAKMIFTLKNNNELQFEDYYDEKLAQIEGITAVQYKSAYRNAAGQLIFAVQFHGADKDYVNLFTSEGKTVKRSVTFAKATNMRIWWSDDKSTVVSLETPFTAGSSNTYYEVMVLDNEFRVIRKYPDVLDYLKPEASDRLISIDYRPDFHLGFANRQVMSIGKQNFLNSYLFNGYANGTYNKLVGENTNLVLGASILHADNNVVEAQYPCRDNTMNNWVISVDTTAAGKNDQLVFDVETYTGLVLASLRVGNTDGGEQIDFDPNHTGMGAIDPAYSTIKTFSRDNDNTVYVAAHLKASQYRHSGIYLSKWKLNSTDERFQKDYLTKKYGTAVFSDTKAITTSTLQGKLVLVAIDESDPNYSKKDKLINETIKLEDQLEPVPNTWFWKGTVKVGRKKYTFTKIVIAKSAN